MGWLVNVLLEVDGNLVNLHLILSVLLHILVPKGFMIGDPHVEGNILPMHKNLLGKDPCDSWVILEVVLEVTLLDSPALQLAVVIQLRFQPSCIDNGSVGMSKLFQHLHPALKNHLPDSVSRICHVDSQLPIGFTCPVT